VTPHEKLTAALDLLEEYVQAQIECEAPARSHRTVQAEDVLAQAREALSC